MAINPWLSNFQEEMTVTQYRVFASIHYLVLLIFLLAFVLVIVNMWQILIKQAKWKTIPLLLFYVYAFICITLRVCCLVTYGLDRAYFFQNLMYAMQPVAKICVGLYQGWMILELAVRIRDSSKDLKYQIKSEKWLNFGLITLVIITTIGFLATLILASVSASKDDENLVFQPHLDRFYFSLAYSYLALFFLMGGLNIFLIRQIKAR